MKKTIITLITVTSCLVSLSHAGEGKGKKGGHKGHHEMMIKKFDTDGDGKLSETEKTAAKAAMAARLEATIAKYDTDGDGELSKDEKKAAITAFKAEMVKKYDTDGDGELSEVERDDAKKAGEVKPFFGHKKGGKRDKKKESK